MHEELDRPIFRGTTLSSLMQDIYDNSKQKKRQIDILINELRPLIKQVQDAAMIVPLIKEYLDVSVKNDDQLVKLASVYQKYLAAEKRAVLNPDGSTSGIGILTDAEKEQLLREVREVIEQPTKDISATDNEIDSGLNNIKEKVEKKMEEIKEKTPEFTEGK